jgi:lipoic acid synthetase
VLRYAKQRAPHRFTKTSIMLGLGETGAEIENAMDDSRAAGVDIFTMGQYLQPSKKHLPVDSFVSPERFAELGRLARSKGFHQVVSSPLSRSSYHAEQAFTA